MRNNISLIFQFLLFQLMFPTYEYSPCFQGFLHQNLLLRYPLILQANHRLNLVKENIF